MRFSIQGYIVDTSDKTVEEKIGEYLMLLVCVYFPHIKVDKVCYKFDAETNTAEIIFEREAKIFVKSDILDTDAQLITSLEPEYFYPRPRQPRYFNLIGYNGHYYIDPKELEDFFMRFQALEGVDDVKFNATENYLKINVKGK